MDLQILFHTFLSKPLTNGEKSTKFVKFSSTLLMNCRFISKNYLHPANNFPEKEIEKSPGPLPTFVAQVPLILWHWNFFIYNKGLPAWILL